MPGRTRRTLDRATLWQIAAIGVLFAAVIAAAVMILAPQNSHDPSHDPRAQASDEREAAAAAQQLAAAYTAAGSGDATALTTVAAPDIAQALAADWDAARQAGITRTTGDLTLTTDATAWTPGTVTFTICWAPGYTFYNQAGQQLTVEGAQPSIPGTLVMTRHNTTWQATTLTLEDTAEPCSG